jgi:hypothetical protein
MKEGQMSAFTDAYQWRGPTVVDSEPRKGSRRGPALLAVLGGLAAAGAAAFQRRQSTGSQPQASESGPEVGRATQTPPAA